MYVIAIGKKQIRRFFLTIQNVLTRSDLGYLALVCNVSNASLSLHFNVKLLHKILICLQIVRLEMRCNVKHPAVRWIQKASMLVNFNETDENTTSNSS